MQFYLQIIEDGKIDQMPGLPKTIEKRFRQIPPEKDWQKKVPCKFCQEDFLPAKLENGWCQTCLDEQNQRNLGRRPALRDNPEQPAKRMLQPSS